MDVVTFSYSLTMIPNWFQALERAYAALKPGGMIGVVDFYISRKWPAPGMRRHSELPAVLLADVVRPRQRLSLSGPSAMAAKPIPDGEAGRAPGQGALPAAEGAVLHLPGPQGVNDHGWAATPRGRGNWRPSACFALAFAVVPLVTTELYPFSRAPMFADAPRQYCDYAVVTPGRPAGSPNAGPRPHSASSATTGAIRSASASASSRPRVRTCSARLRRRSSVQRRGDGAAEADSRLPYVEVEQSVVGPTDADHVGVVWMERWRVDNPNFQPDERSS